jgi:hypothetical protein
VRYGAACDGFKVIVDAWMRRRLLRTPRPLRHNFSPRERMRSSVFARGVNPISVVFGPVPWPEACFGSLHTTLSSPPVRTMTSRVEACRLFRERADGWNAALWRPPVPRFETSIHVTLRMCPIA